MPTQESFKQCPPFPSNVPTAEIPAISYKELKNHSSNDSKKLFEACREQGFFLLDLRGSEDGERLLHDAEVMFNLSIALFEIEHKELLKYQCNLPKDITGYKPASYTKVDDGKRDNIEFYSLSRDETLGVTSKRQDPELFKVHREEFRQFFLRSQTIVTEILAQLDKHLGLAIGTLSSLNPLDQPSHTVLRLLHAPPPLSPGDSSISLGGHTDIGTITMLFHIVGGLQILPAGSDNINSNWRYIRPQPGCALINIGDSLVEWSGGVLRSSLHRVITPPGEQADFPRRSVGYLIRPPHDGSMGRLSSAAIPPLSEDEEKETRSVDEWALWKMKQIVNGERKPQTTGGQPVVAAKGIMTPSQVAVA